MADQETGPIPGVDAADLVDQIQRAIQYAGLDSPAGQGGMRLDTVQIQLAVVAEVEVGFKPKFKVPFLGWEVGAERASVDIETHTVDVTLRTPFAPITDVEPDGLLRGVDVETALPGVIAAVRELLAQAAEGPTRLVFGAATLTFKFDVSRSGHLELAVPGIGRKRGSAVTVTFTFSPAVPAP